MKTNDLKRIREGVHEVVDDGTFEELDMGMDVEDTVPCDGWTRVHGPMLNNPDLDD